MLNFLPKVKKFVTRAIDRGRYCWYGSREVVKVITLIHSVQCELSDGRNQGAQGPAIRLA